MNPYDESPRDETGHDETGPIMATPVSTTPVTTSAPISQTSSLPTVPTHAPPPGWYPEAGGQRYWDGQQWTEHRAPAAATGPVLAPFIPAYHSTVVVNDARANGAEVAVAWVITVVTLAYMLPWAIAATRGKSNSVAIALLNFLLGWTFIGWLAALIMACMPHRIAAIQHRY